MMFRPNGPPARSAGSPVRSFSICRLRFGPVAPGRPAGRRRRGDASMGMRYRGLAGVLAMAGSVAAFNGGLTAAWAQDQTVVLPDVEVTSTRLPGPSRPPVRRGAPASSPATGPTPASDGETAGAGTAG